MKQQQTKKARGEAHGRAHFDKRQVQNIRDAVALGFSQHAVARAMARVAGTCSQATVNGIVNGRLWAHLPDSPRGMRRLELEEMQQIMRRDGGVLITAEGVRRFGPSAAVADDVDVEPRFDALLSDHDDTDDDEALHLAASLAGGGK
jgi:hypothetical protein